MKHLLTQCVFLILALHWATFSAAPADIPNLKQLLRKTNVLREYDLAELFHLVYKAAPELVEESLLELGDGQWPPAGIEDQLIEDQLIDPPQITIGNVTINVTACSLCKGLVGFLALRARQRPPMFDKLTENFIKICEKIAPFLDVKGDIYCRGTLEHQLEQVFVVVSNRNNTVKEMCEFLNLCFPPPLLKSMQPKKSSNSKPNPIKQRISRSKSISVPPPNSIKVVQLADVHVEPRYKSGSAYLECGLPVCCDPDISGSGSAGSWGEYTCNIPQATIELFLGEVKNMNPDIILFSGDVPPHSTWDETQESQTECSRTLVNTLKKILPEHKVYPNVGNHENYPTNLLSVRKMNYTKDFLDFYKNAWQPLANFSDENLKNIGDGGYYSKLLRDGLRLISFNTNYMYTYNFFNVDNHKEYSTGGRPPIIKPTVYPPEYDVMREFIQEALQNATKDGERVILMGHHPPGSADYIVRGSRWYRELVLNYTDTIVLQPAGHTHYDEFRMIYDDEGTARSVVLVAPSMSSEYTRNPSMRVFYLHNETFDLLDYDHYYLNLGLSEAKVELLYSAKEDYGMENLKPESWHQLLLSFENPDVLNQHRNHSQADAPLDECTEDCQIDYICRMKNVNYDEYKECATKIDWSEITKPTRPTKPTPPNVDSAPSLHSVTVITLVISALILVLIQTLIPY